MRWLIQYMMMFAILSFSLFSCEDSDYDDNEAPQIYVYHVDDTLYLDFSSSRFNRIEIGFSDNEALSSYNIYLSPDTDYFGTENNPVIVPNGRDSLAYDGVINTSFKVDIFGLKRDTISTSLYRISSTFSIYDYEQNTTNSYAMRTGQYLLSVECLDIAGNSTKEEVKSVCVLYPDSTLIADR